MSSINEYYSRHARPFTLGRVTPLGLSAGGVGVLAGGLAQGIVPAAADNALAAVACLGILAFLADAGLAALVGPRAPEVAAAPRSPGQTRTFGTDRHLVIAVLIAGVGLGVLGYALTVAGKSPGPPSLIALVFAVFTLWGGILAVKSPQMTVVLDDSGVRDDSFPFRHRFVSWERIVSASVFATTPGSAQVILELRADSVGSHGQGSQEGKRMRIPCQFLTETADELLQAITSDPNFPVKSEDRRHTAEEV